MAFTGGTRAVINFVVEGVTAGQRQINQLGGSIDGLGGAAKNSLKELAGFAGIGLGLGALAKEVMDAQREFDKLNGSLVTATGSTASAAQAFEALQAFAATTPFSLKEATEAFLTMRNLGLDPSEKALRSYGNTASAMGKDLSQMVEAVADAAGGELERLKEFGITGAKSGDQVALTFQGMTKKIGNNAKEIQAYLQSIGDVNFGGAMEKRANSLDGAISNLGDTWTSTMRTIAQNGIGDEMQSGVIALSNSLNDLSAILNVVGGAAKKEGDQVKETSVLHAGITAVFETLAVTGVNLAYVLTAVGKDAGALAATAVAIAKLDFATAKGIANARRADAEQERKDVDAKSAAIIGAGAKAQAAADKQAAARKAAGTDQLAQYAIELTADQRRAKAKQDIFDLENKLNGTNAQTSGDLAKLKIALDTGAISAGEYAKYVAKINKETIESSTAYKDQLKQLDMSAGGIKRRADALALLNQREQEHTDFLRESGQLDEEGSITRIAALQVQALRDQKAAAEGMLSIAKKKIGNEKEQQDIAGQIGNLNSQINNRQTKEKEDLFLLDQKNFRLAADNYADVIENARGEAKTQQDALRGQLDQNAELGKTPQQIAAITASRLRDTAARAEENAYIAQGLDWTGQLSAAYTAQADALRKRADAVQAGAGVDIEQATRLLEVMTAIDESTQSAAQGMADSFGTVGAAIGGLTTALSGYGRTQAAIAAQLATTLNSAGTDPVKIEQAKAAASKQAAQAQIKSYGDMAGAAKGFFKEGSKGYSALQATEKAFRAYEMAMALESMVKKIFFKETEVAANVGLNATKIAGEATASAASTGLAATEASAWGITAVVKALASLPYPMNLIAGATTLAAVLAVGASMFGGVGGGSAPSVSEQRQKAQGTGSVLGDSDAKSESIANSLDILEKNSGSDLNYTRGMLESLRAIETSIGGLGSQLVQGGLTGAYTDSASTGFFAKLGNSIFGGDTTVTDKGITANKITLSGALSGAWTAKQYTDTKTDGGWFHSDKNNTTTTGLGAAADMQFAKVIQNLAGGITEAAKLLGVGGDAFTQRLNSFVIDIGKVSLKGMTGDDIQKALEAVFSKLGDDMAQFGVGGLAQFQQVGEGYLETLTRIATNYSMLDSNLMSIGMTFGAVGLSSIAAREDLISMAGGMSSLSDKVSSFSDHFLTEAEQLAPVAKYVAEQMAALGYASVDTREEFKALVLSLNPADAASRTLFNSLLDLESAFDKTHVAAEDLAKTEKEIASERKDLQNQLDDLTMTAAELLKKQRDALDASNRALFDQVQAAQAAKDANDAAKASLSDFLTSTKAFATSVKGFNNNLMTGSLSTLTPEQQLAEARRQFEQTKAAALTGDTAAQSGLQAIENTFLTLSQKLNGGDAQYSSDLATVMQANDQLAAWATSQVDVAQASLDALNAQVDGITTLNVTMASVAQNLQYLPELTGASSLPNYVPVSLPTIDFSNYGTASQAPLLAAIKSLQDEVKALRADAQQQTADKLVVAGKAALAAADRVVEGVGDAIDDAVNSISNNKVDLSDF